MLLVLEKAKANSNYFTMLAQHALSSSDHRIQELIVREGQLGKCSADEVAGRFKSWYERIIDGSLAVAERSAAAPMLLNQGSITAVLSEDDSDKEDCSVPRKRMLDDDQCSSSGRELTPTASSVRPTANITGTKGNLLRRKRVRCKNSPRRTKGVYPTSHGYRVQLNMRPVLNSLSQLHRSGNGNIKFSRNCREFREALWLYEVILLISDVPHSLEDLVSRGNYEELGQQCFPLRLSTTGYSEYYRCLGASISTLRDDGIISLEEFEEAVAAYRQVPPPRINEAHVDVSNSNTSVGAAAEGTGTDTTCHSNPGAQIMSNLVIGYEDEPDFITGIIEE